MSIDDMAVDNGESVHESRTRSSSRSSRTNGEPDEGAGSVRHMKRRSNSSSEGDPDTYKVLSYNICWGCMEADEGDNTGMKNGLKEKCSKNVGRIGSHGENGLGLPITQCAINMGKAIPRYNEMIGGYDLLGFQEASNFGDLFLDERGMDLEVVEHGLEMRRVHTKGQHVGQPKKAWAVSAYNPGKLGHHDKVVRGAVLEGRPFLVLIFDAKKLMFINVHNAQPNAGRKFAAMLETIHKELAESFRDRPERKEYRVIMVGDFNDRRARFPGCLSMPWNGVTFHIEKPYAPSCCQTKLNEKSKSPGDFIFDSASVAVNRIPGTYSNKLAQSDHRPVEAILKPAPVQVEPRSCEEFLKMMRVRGKKGTRKSRGSIDSQKSRRTKSKKSASLDTGLRKPKQESFKGTAGHRGSVRRSASLDAIKKRNHTGRLSVSHAYR